MDEGVVGGSCLGSSLMFLVVKSPLYLMENLLGGQLPPVLWRWHVGLLSQINKFMNQLMRRNISVTKLCIDGKRLWFSMDL